MTEATFTLFMQCVAIVIATGVAVSIACIGWLWHQGAIDRETAGRVGFIMFCYAIFAWNIWAVFDGVPSAVVFPIMFVLGFIAGWIERPKRRKEDD